MSCSDKMLLNPDISSALQLLEYIKEIVEDGPDRKLHANISYDLDSLVSILENPIFRSIVTIQDSLSELNQQLYQHPSILSVDFDITPAGELVINVPPGAELFENNFGEDFQQVIEFDEQRVPSAQLSPGSPQTLGFRVIGKIPNIRNLTDKDVININDKPLDASLSHQQAMNILQKARGLVELVVAKTAADEKENIHRSPSVVSDVSKSSSDMILQSEWAQVEAIELVNDGTGLGFGIIGGRVMGVIVKTILPGGVAERDGRLQSGDHILQIGDVNLCEMGSEEVATVLRQSGTHVRLIVARPVDATAVECQDLNSNAPIVPTRVLHNPVELDHYLTQHGYPKIFKCQENDFINSNLDHSINLPRLSTSPSLSHLNLDMDLGMPEMEKFTVELIKDSNGLGITIAGYVCEKEELSGIFVKSVSKGSVADLSGKIRVNDRIVEVDGKSLQGYTNHQAVDVLRNSGNTVTLCLERYLRGPKYEQLQQAIAANEMKPSDLVYSSVQSQLTMSKKYSIDEGSDYSLEKNDDTFVSEANNQRLEILRHPQFNTELTQVTIDRIKATWNKILGSNMEIVVAQLQKFGESSGLGISLEGTVDVENGKEVRPHHYIRSILPEGPVGKNGVLKSGDELLEVNGYKLLGMNHLEVVSILKELPMTVRIVCGRNTLDAMNNKLSNNSNNTFASKNVLGGSLQNLLTVTDRLVKAKSDGSLATSMTVTVSDNVFNKMKSRSLEPLTGLAMWSSEPQIIELIKGERGLGFSILDYQDPIDPNDTVIVIRSLVPGGVAQVDGRLIPGDRLLFVNDTVLENASLDQAVQALKGAAKGIVRIGVAKPLPIPDSVSHNHNVYQFGYDASRLQMPSYMPD